MISFFPNNTNTFDAYIDTELINETKNGHNNISR